MNFGAILAGGIGSRMKNDLPKQFIDLAGKPIIIHTLEKMFKSNIFDYLIIAIHPEYVDYLQKLLNKFDFADNNKILIVTGGKERIDTIENVINIVNEYSQSSDDILLLHDAVRPFVTNEILENSITTAQKEGACVAVVPAVDTIYEIKNNVSITGFPTRKYLYNGQSPDTFKLGVLNDAFNSLSADEKKEITGTVQICASKGINISAIEGSYQNIKITTNYDLAIAKQLLIDGEE